jgi:hypothetical protein
MATANGQRCATPLIHEDIYPVARPDVIKEQGLSLEELVQRRQSQVPSATLLKVLGPPTDFLSTSA